MDLENMTLMTFGPRYNSVYFNSQLIEIAPQIWSDHMFANASNYGDQNCNQWKSYQYNKIHIVAIASVEHPILSYRIFILTAVFNVQFFFISL